jgi:ABC-2 type transport system ATP-binding protein
MTAQTSRPPAAPGQTLAALHGASKRYGGIVALAETDLAVRAGEVLAVLGANGAGKTTTLGLLTGRLAPDGGRAELFGADPRDAAVRRGIGVMLQEAGLGDTIRVAEHVHLFSSYYANPRPVAETLAMAGLTDLAKRPYQALSGGQQRRVQFALALCGRPRLLFVDEPTAGLDVESRRAFWTVIRQLRDEGTGIVLTTHYLEEADALADRVVLMAGGKVLAEDTPSGMKARAAGKRVRARSALAAEVLRAWPEVTTAQDADGRFDVLSNDVESLLRRWLAADAGLADLEVRPLSLEDAFVALTSDDSITDKDLA